MAASRLHGPNQRFLKLLVWVHRWLGVAACVVFASWFASGAIMVFHPFPELPAVEKALISPAVDLGAIRVTPAAALAAAGNSGDGLRLVQRAGSPAYIIDRPWASVGVSAIDGRTLPLLTARQALTIGTNALSRRPMTVEGPFDYDQWVADNQFDPQRPFYRISTGDQEGTHLYISARTGEVVQRTRGSERVWSWLGAVLHWAYFTPIRRNFTVWDQTVWWGSLIAMIVAISGATLGVIRTLAIVRSPRSGLTPFRLPWLRYHHLIGLFFGPFVITWILSGWLSMDHARIFSDGRATPVQSAAYKGLTLTEAARQIPLVDVARLEPAVAISLKAVGGRALLTATRENGQSISFERGQMVQGVALTAAEQGLHRAWPSMAIFSSRVVAPNDFYALAEAMPPTTRRFDLHGDQPLSVYVDSATGDLVTVMDHSRVAYTWLYYALHTFKFPPLINHPFLRYAIVLAAMITGFAFSITGMAISLKRLKKTF